MPETICEALDIPEITDDEKHQLKSSLERVGKDGFTRAEAVLDIMRAAKSEMTDDNKRLAVMAMIQGEILNEHCGGGMAQLMRAFASAGDSDE